MEIGRRLFGVNAMNSASFDIPRFFNGAPTDGAIRVLAGGSVAIAAGLAGRSGLVPYSRKG